MQRSPTRELGGHPGSWCCSRCLKRAWGVKARIRREMRHDFRLSRRRWERRVILEQMD